MNSIVICKSALWMQEKNILRNKKRHCRLKHRTRFTLSTRDNCTVDKALSKNYSITQIEENNPSVISTEKCREPKKCVSEAAAVVEEIQVMIAVAPTQPDRNHHHRDGHKLLPVIVVRNRHQGRHQGRHHQGLVWNPVVIIHEGEVAVIKMSKGTHARRGKDWMMSALNCRVI